jgi:DNA-binding MarR family transcriptional regulator
MASRRQLIAEIAEGLARRHSTATVLYHQAVAEDLGLGPTDHKCLDLLREHGALTGSQLAAIIGVTTGAVTGVVARLERAGYVRREPDPEDGRKQIVYTVAERLATIRDVTAPMRDEVAAMLAGFDSHQLATIAEFLTRSTEIVYHQAALLRAQTVPELHRNTAKNDKRSAASAAGGSTK